MAIAFDASSDITTIQVGVAATPITWTHTCSGAGRALIVQVGTYDTSGGDATITAVTYNSVEMQEAVPIVGPSTADSDPRVNTFYLANPATGANTVSVTFTGSVNAVFLAAMSFTGVDQITPVDVQSSATQTSGTTISDSVTTEVAGAWLVAHIVNEGAGVDGVVIDAGTEVYDINDAASVNFSGGYRGPIAAAGSEAMGWSGLENDGTAISVISLRPQGNIVQVQQASGSSDTASEVTATFGSTPTSGNLLVACVFTRANTLTDPAGWTTAVNENNTTENDHLRISYKIAGSSEATAVTFTHAINDHAALGIFEISGINRDSPLDVTASTGRTVSATSISSGTTGAIAQNNEIAFVAAGIRDTPTGIQKWDNLYTRVHNLGGSPGANEARLIDGYKILSTAGTAEATASWATALTAMGAVATFKAAGVKSGSMWF